MDRNAQSFLPKYSCFSLKLPFAHISIIIFTGFQEIDCHLPLSVLLILALCSTFALQLLVPTSKSFRMFLLVCLKLHMKKVYQRSDK